MRRERLILIIGLVLAGVAVLMVRVYLAQQRQALIEEEKRRMAKFTDMQKNQLNVFVAKKDIAAGSEIQEEDLEVKNVPKEYMEPQAVTNIGRIKGMATIIDIKKGEQITLTKLKWSQEARQGIGSLASVTPIGKRAVTIPVDSIGSLAGMIKPGDYVDILATVAIPIQLGNKQVTQKTVIPLFQNILLLATGVNLSSYSGSPATQDRGGKGGTEQVQAPPHVTLALTPQEASIIAFVQEQGKLRLVLRSPADSKPEPFQAANWDTVLQYLMPKAMPPEAGEGEEGIEITEKPRPGEIAKPEEFYVEIYRGLKKEKVLLSE